MQLLLQVRATSQTRLLASGKVWLYNVRGRNYGREKWNHRSLSVTTRLAQVHDSPLHQSDGVVQGVTGAFESSAQARWAADAAYTSELPAQGDLSSIGLGGYSPTGLVQNMLEWVHVHAGLPWWGSIVVCTILMRSILFPLIVNLQKNALRMNNILPDVQKIQDRVRLYKEAGEDGLARMETIKLKKFYEQNGCNPIKALAAPLVQIPIFISFFTAIRGMSYAPVESMKSGGVFWFVDLTVPDPFYILPIINSALFMVSIEIGGDVGVSNPQLRMMKPVMKALAVIMIPVTGSFPSGMFMYWTTSTVISVGQVVMLKVPRFRKWLNYPTVIKHSTTQADKLPGFLETVKKNYRTAMAATEAKQRKQDAEKKRQRLLNDKSIKLYDKPPSKQ